MNKKGKIAVIFILIAVVTVVIIAKQSRINTENSRDSNNLQTKSTTAVSPNPAVPKQDLSAPASKSLPKLVDLGADKCIPCKMMAPILEEIKEEYVGQMEVEIIDVWENSGEAKKYGVKIIPTQIFYDISGKELFRHEGFFSKEDILGKWNELGINLAKGTQNESR